MELGARITSSGSKPVDFLKRRIGKKKAREERIDAHNYMAAAGVVRKRRSYLSFGPLGMGGGLNRGFAR